MIYTDLFIYLDINLDCLFCKVFITESCCLAVYKKKLYSVELNNVFL